MRHLVRFTLLLFALLVFSFHSVVAETNKNDAAKNLSKAESAASNSCFLTQDSGRSLHGRSCNVAELEIAARNGQVYAQNQLGLFSVLIVEKGTDIRQARQWFEKAARRGYAPAQVNLAVTYMNGWGTEQNYG